MNKTQSVATELDSGVWRKLTKQAPACKLINRNITSLADYLTVFDSLFSQPDELFWFRGHADIRWKLCPSALRFESEDQRARAIGSISEFRHR